MDQNALLRIRDGTEGVKDTLYIMSRLVRRYKRDPDLIATANRLTAHVPAKDWAGQVAALHEFVRDEIRYTLDVNGVETLRTPERLLRERQGDCDDMSLLLATLLESIGHPTRFVAVGESPGTLTHVYVETRVGDKWVALETTEPVEAGWEPPGMVNRFKVNN